MITSNTLRSKLGSHRRLSSLRMVSRYFIIMFFFGSCALSIAFGKADSSVLWMAWVVILASLYSIILVRRNIYLLIVFGILGYLNYSVVLPNYIRILSSSYFTSFSDDPVSLFGLGILVVFVLLLTSLLPTKIKVTKLQQDIFSRYGTRHPHVIAFVLSAILFYILVFKFRRPSIDGLRGSPSPLYEYSMVFFIVGFYFTGQNKFCRTILTALLVLFALQNFVFGGRIIGIQLIMLYFLMFYAHKVNFSRVFPFVFAGFMLMSAIGVDRANFSLSVATLHRVFERVKDGLFALDTSYSAYFTSLTFLKVEDLVSVGTRLELFGRFVLSILLGGRIENSSLPIYTRAYFLHYNGGILPYHFHFYLGWFGVFVSVCLLRLYVSLLNNLTYKSSGLSKCLGIYVVASTFRWYLYSPLILLRGVLLLVLTYYCVNAVNRISFRGKETGLDLTKRAT